MKKYIFILYGLGLLFLTSCTSNARSKNWGGTYTIKLPTNTKLVEATWKDANLWYLTRPMKENEIPETLTFQEDSQFGVMEGTVIFVESK
jgi:hypothetical protein